MAKPKTRYTCDECGTESIRWTGQCSACNSWNTLVEHVVLDIKATTTTTMLSYQAQPPQMYYLQDIAMQEHPRLPTGLGELDRVLGGGIVPGSLILLGGEPGIGKSTLLMQTAFYVAETLRKKVIYVSGEESGQQIKLRAERMGFTHSEYFHLLPETEVAVIAQLLESQKPSVAILDSIQAVYDSRLDSPPGSISQVKNTSNLFLKLAKQHDISTWIIGHVNKEGSIAGPKVLEHMVDTVLYFEGERYKSYRLLRTIKNRFGATHEVGVFDMTGLGLAEVSNPSALFLAEFQTDQSGSAIVVTLEGTRPILVEIQALSYPTYTNLPKRSSNGIGYQRLIQIVAVLEKRIGLSLSKADVLVNVVSGLTIDEPAADLGTAMALLSSVRDIAIDPQTVFIGEIGLGGEIRNVNQIELRLKEAVKLGFNRAIIPASALPLQENIPGMTTVGVRKLMEALVHLKRQEIPAQGG